MEKEVRSWRKTRLAVARGRALMEEKADSWRKIPVGGGSSWIRYWLLGESSLLDDEEGGIFLEKK